MTIAITTYPYAWAIREDFTLWSDEKLEAFVADIDQTLKLARRWLYRDSVLMNHCELSRVAPANELSIRTALKWLDSLNA